MSDWNTGVIQEFRKNHGKVGGNFEGAPLLLINHSGARTRKTRINPVMYLKDGHRYVVFASEGGADNHPDCYHNLKAHPALKIDLRNHTPYVTAEETQASERERTNANEAPPNPQLPHTQTRPKP